MSSYIFDIETNGLLDTVTKIHCIALKDIATGEVSVYNDDAVIESDGTLQECLDKLHKAELLIAHNGLAFDAEVLYKIYDCEKLPEIFDTLITSQLIWPDIKKIDMMLPKNFKGSHALRAWGHRLGHYKGDFYGPWTELTQEMQDYCIQDVEVTLRLYRKIKDQFYSKRSVDLEHELSPIIRKIEEVGIKFNEGAAEQLYSELVARAYELKTELQKVFPPWFDKVKEIEIKKPTYIYMTMEGNKIRVPVEGNYTKIQLTEFNPGSGAHIRNRFKNKYNWTSSKITEKGNPSIDGEILETLEYPEAKLLSEFTLIKKRLGMILDGVNGWLKMVHSDKRMRPRYIQNGTITGRSTHMKPNIAQIPAVRSLYGRECRALFTAEPDKVLVGCDADALELRCLAGYIARWDKGAMAYMFTCGEDIHKQNAEALGTSRDIAKTYIYACIYGAGYKKLGSIVSDATTDSLLMSIGKQSKHKLEESLKGLIDLEISVKEKYSDYGHLKGLDGRLITPRTEHSALNTLLQSAGAVLMKQATIILDKMLKKQGFDANMVVWCHDEWIIETKEEYADKIGCLAKQALELAGKSFCFPCDITGSYTIGKNWSEIH